jgi:hypothetical protein
MKYSINLFPSRKSAYQIISDFIVYYLRYALVLTLLFVVIIFFLRMRLDQSLIEERAKMTQKKAIISATQGIRDDLESIQKKVKNTNDILLKQDRILAMLEYVTSVIPVNFETVRAVVGENEFVLEGTAEEYHVIQNLQKKLINDAMFEEIDADDVTRDKNGIYTLKVMLESWNPPKYNSNK